MKTVNDLIKELQSLKPSSRELPVVVHTPSDQLLEAEWKALFPKYELENPSHILITWD